MTVKKGKVFVVLLIILLLIIVALETTLLVFATINLVGSRHDDIDYEDIIKINSCMPDENTKANYYIESGSNKLKWEVTNVKNLAFQAIGMEYRAYEYRIDKLSGSMNAEHGELYETYRGVSVCYREVVDREYSYIFKLHDNKKTEYITTYTVPVDEGERLDSKTAKAALQVIYRNAIDNWLKS